jgi:hypothetical protein
VKRFSFNAFRQTSNARRIRRFFVAMLGCTRFLCSLRAAKKRSFCPLHDPNLGNGRMDDERMAKTNGAVSVERQAGIEDDWPVPVF